VDDPRAFYSQIERAEAVAWKDQWDAAPEDFRARTGMYYREVGGATAFVFPPMPLPLFNRVIGLGFAQPLTPETLAAVLDIYRDTPGKGFFIHHAPLLQADGLLASQGLVRVGGWERIVRDNRPLTSRLDNPEGLVIKPVNDPLRDPWVDFVNGVYHLPFQPWLACYYGRPNWRHYVALQGKRIVAARSFYTTHDGWVWSGVDAPVPGMMTRDYQPDFLIWEQAIHDHLQAGAVYFVADIEHISPAGDLPSYQVFLGQLNFDIPYRREHYTRP
jgi:hypothetical protein